MTFAYLAKKAAIALALLPLLAGVAVLGIVSVFALPNESIAKNILERPEIVQARRANNGRVIDADTECIGLSVGLYSPHIDKRSLVQRAVAAKSLLGCDQFFYWLETNDTNGERDYFRYWHGHAVLARPLLSIMPYNDYRGVIFTISLTLLAVLTWRIAKDFNQWVALSVLAAFFVVNAMGFWVVGTKAATWFLVIGGAVFATRRANEPLPALGFFILGALTAYFDFLTTPVLIPVMAALCWMLYSLKAKTADKPWMALAVLGAFWAAGYGGLWFAKFVISAVVLEVDVWRDVAASVFHRTRGAVEGGGASWPGEAIWANIASLKTIWGIAAVGAYFVAPLASQRGRRNLGILWQRHKPIIALVAMPILWLELLSNHSQIHAAFTQLNFAPAFIVLWLCLFGEIEKLTPANN